ncbi:MAG: hypothetical protein Q4F31_10795 [Eubacteriales bacterium]|nr:hypothetical protein [Eubacteriales bacterium]
MELTKEMMEKAMQAASAEELLEIAKAEGLELSASEAEMYFDFLHSSRELTDEELAQVAGGKEVKFKYGSIAKCHDCGYWEFMPRNRKLKECPKCGSTNVSRVFGI